MTKTMRQFAASLNQARKARSAQAATEPREAMPHHVTMAAIGVTAPEFI